MQLAASDAEKREIGGSLSDALQYFPEASPLVKFLNVLGPWSGVIDGVAAAVYRRAVYIAQHRVRGPTSSPSTPTTTRVERPPFVDEELLTRNGQYSGESEDIVAPNPAGGY